MSIELTFDNFCQPLYLRFCPHRAGKTSQTSARTKFTNIIWLSTWLLSIHAYYCVQRVHDPMQEIALGPACWLWDYLRRRCVAVCCASVAVCCASVAVCCSVLRQSQCQSFDSHILHFVPRQPRRICVRPSFTNFHSYCVFHWYVWLFFLQQP